jgi:amidohydrolase
MVTQLHAGTVNNVVPELAVGSGTLRTMRAADHRRAHEAIRDIAGHVSAAYGCTAAVEFTKSEPALTNDPELASRALPILEAMGHQGTAEFRSFGSDDFSHYCAQARGLMLFVGTGSVGGGLHDPTYLPDDGYVGVVADALVAGYCAAADPG